MTEEQYNEHIVHMKNMQDEPIWITDLRNNLPDIWRPMYQLDATAVSRAVSSIILKEDGSVEIHFKAEEVF